MANKITKNLDNCKDGENYRNVKIESIEYDDNDIRAKIFEILSADVQIIDGHAIIYPKGLKLLTHKLKFTYDPDTSRAKTTSDEIGMYDEFPFGKHKGKKVIEVFKLAPDYMAWAVPNMDKLKFSQEVIDAQADPTLLDGYKQEKEEEDLPF